MEACERCNVEFESSHSCSKPKIGDHFAGNSWRAVYNHILGSVPGKVKTKAVNSGIVLSNSEEFGKVEVQKHGLLVEVGLSREVSNPLLIKRVRMGKRLVHTFRVRNKMDVDKISKHLGTAYKLRA